MLAAGTVGSPAEAHSDWFTGTQVMLIVRLWPEGCSEAAVICVPEIFSVKDF